MKNHYYLDGEPACGADKQGQLIPAANPKQCSCTDCAFKMVGEADTLKEMESWMVRFQELRKAVAWINDREKERALWEEMRVAPRYTPIAQPAKGMFRPDSTVNVPSGQTMKGVQQIISYPWVKPKSRIIWLHHVGCLAQQEREAEWYLNESYRMPVDLWYDADPGMTCNQRHVYTSSGPCGRPAVQISVDQFGLPLTRCEYAPD